MKLSILIIGRQRLKFLKTGTTFLVVRDPFERIVSAYLVRLFEMITYRSLTFSLKLIG